VTGPIEFASVPTWIPVEVCTAVGQEPTPEAVDTCLQMVIADVADDGVAAPPGEDVAGLAEVVSEAAEQGIDLKVVVVDRNPPIDPPLRDIATQVGKAYPGSTVLVLSPHESGTYSTVYDRVTLEAGQDVAEGRPAVQATKNFVSELTTPHFPWTTFTIVVVLFVAVAVVATRVLQNKARETVPEPNPGEAG
jgi:hypothetical protein